MAGYGSLAGPCRPRAPKVGYPAAGRLHVPRAGASQASRLRPRSSQALPTQFAPSGVSQRSQRSRCAAAVGLARRRHRPGVSVSRDACSPQQPTRSLSCRREQRAAVQPCATMAKGATNKASKVEVRLWLEGREGAAVPLLVAAACPALHPQPVAARHLLPARHALACVARLPAASAGAGRQLPCMPLWLLALSFRGCG